MTLPGVSLVSLDLDTWMCTRADCPSLSLGCLVSPHEQVVVVRFGQEYYRRDALSPQCIFSGVHDVGIPTTEGVNFGSFNAIFVMVWLKSATLILVFHSSPPCFFLQGACVLL